MTAASVPRGRNEGARLVDSPWLWVGLFTLAGAAALVVARPKYQQRQPQLERQFYARQVGGQSVMGDAGPSRPSLGSRLFVPLAPLIGLLVAVSGVCWAVVLRQLRRPVPGESSAADRHPTARQQVRGP